MNPDFSTLSDDALRDYLKSREWYHTIELRPGIETPGWFDVRGVAATLPWPDLTGKRCLDVGTFDGFWAQEMVRRGASRGMVASSPTAGRPVVSSRSAVVVWLKVMPEDAV